MTDHDSGAKEQAGDGGVAGEAGTNVVPFPRSWYGSVDELVPITTDPPRRRRPSVDASAFWGGEAAPVSAAGNTIAGTPRTDPAQEATRQEQCDDEPDLAWEARRDDSPGAAERSDWKEPRFGTTAAPPRTQDRRRRRPLALSVLAAALVACLGVGAVVAGGGGGSDPKASHTAVSHGDSARSATANSPAASEVVTKRVGRRGEKDHALRGRKVVPRHAPVTSSSPTSTTQSDGRLTPTVSSPPPPSESTSSSGAKESTSSAGGSRRSAGSGAVPAGALPDVQQTNQQP